MRDLNDTRTAILHVVKELQRLDNRLPWIGKDLPQLQLSQGFSIRAEMRGAIDCVRRELLTDAIITLTSVSTSNSAPERSSLRRASGFRGNLQSSQARIR